MSAREPLRVGVSAGAVVITCLPADALDIAAALGSLFVLEEGTRPSWTDDVVALHAGAALAQLQTAGEANRVDVAFYHPGSPALRLLAGGDPA